MYPYDEKHISKYGKPAKPSPAFKKAMDEIEANVVLYEPTEALEAVAVSTFSYSSEAE